MNVVGEQSNTHTLSLDNVVARYVGSPQWLINMDILHGEMLLRVSYKRSKHLMVIRVSH